MNDCPNADVRDLLPDLVNGRLDPSSRASVEAHLAGCADCQAEVALLRELRGSLRRTPALDLAAITAAIPAYRAPARRAWVGWRTAAAITVLVAGGSSIALIDRGPSTVDSVALSVPAPAESSVASSVSSGVVTKSAEPPAATAPSPLGVPGTLMQPAPASASGGRELAMSGGSLADLSDRELDALLRDIESLDAVPTTDVDAAVISPMAPSPTGRGSP